MGKKIAKLFAVAGVLGLSLFAASANANCLASNLMVERVLSYGTYGYVYLRPAGALTNSYYYAMYTTSDKILSAAANAQTDRSQVNAYGNIATCPTTAGYRSLGTGIYLYIIN